MDRHTESPPLKRIGLLLFYLVLLGMSLAALEWLDSEFRLVREDHSIVGRWRAMVEAFRLVIGEITGRAIH